VVRALAFLIGAALLASGCNDRTPATSGQPARDVSAPTSSSYGAVVRVLRTDGATLHADWILFRAQQRAVASCMHARGFEYDTNSGGSEPIPGIATAEVRASTNPPTYGVAAQASAFLRRAGTTTDNSPVTAQDAYARSLSPAQSAAYSIALDGPAGAMAVLKLPSGRQLSYETRGCLAEARSQVFGSARAALMDALLPSDVDNSFFATLGNDQRYRVALERWRGCMRRAGHRAKNPTTLIGELKQMLATGVRTAVIASREKAAAKADMACDESSRLRATQNDLLVSYVHSLPPDVRAALSGVADQRRAALARSRT